MSQKSIFEKNRLSLSRVLRARLRYVESDPGFLIAPSRSGMPVPSILREGKPIPLHSSFDPVKEARRLAESTPLRGFYACYGIGAGYHLRELLASPEVSGIIAIDFSIDLFSSLASNIDLSDIFSDPRVAILIDPDEADIERCFFERYLPFLAGQFNGLPLRSRVDLDRPAFEAASQSIARALARVSDDYTVQSNFGKVWFRNAIGNLERAEERADPIPATRRALICAAGPSLETQLPEITRLKSSGDFLIAVDTALPFLMKSGLVPDAVVTLDCQLISYYHFMEGYPRGVPLVMDLASPPLISRIAARVHFFSSGHPFCRYVSSRWRSFPMLDTSGGNVTHASLSLADALGAREIRLFGADFSYPRGKCYARGTYIYRYFEIRASRFRPVESLFSEFLYRNPRLDRDASASSFRYVTKPLRSYRDRLEAYASTLTADFLPARGEGLPVREYLGASRALPHREKPAFAPGKQSGSFRDFLIRYRSILASLGIPANPPLTRIHSLPDESRDVWMTILPQAAAFSKTSACRGIPASDLLSHTRDWTLGIIDDALNR
jgi:hypothetical protein